MPYAPSGSNTGIEEEEEEEEEVEEEEEEEEEEENNHLRDYMFSQPITILIFGPGRNSVLVRVRTCLRIILISVSGSTVVQRGTDGFRTLGSARLHEERVLSRSLHEAIINAATK
jgi:hypothetical protein